MRDLNHVWQPKDDFAGVPKYLPFLNKQGIKYLIDNLPAEDKLVNSWTRLVQYINRKIFFN